MKRCLRLFCLSLVFVSGLLAAPGVIEAEPVVIQLRSLQTAIVAGQPFTIGVDIRHKPGYHTYWHSPGTVGLATSIKWTLPEGFTIGELQWPPPQRCKMVAYNTYGYEKDVLLLAEVTPPAVVPAGSIEIKAAITFMACAEVRCCNLQCAERSLTLAVGTHTAAAEPAVVAEFAAARRQLPAAMPGVTGSFSQTRDFFQVEVVFPAEIGDRLPAAEGLYFYPCGGAVDSIRPQEIRRTATGYRMTLPRSEFAPPTIPVLEGLLVSTQAWPQLDNPALLVTTRLVPAATP